MKLIRMIGAAGSSAYYLGSPERAVVGSPNGRAYTKKTDVGSSDELAQGQL